jgi:hypothetical protein
MRARRVFLALALAVGLVVLATLLLSRESGVVQAHQKNASEASSQTPETPPAGDVTTQGSGAVWAIETVDDPKQFSEMTDRSLALDGDGHPHIAYGGDYLYYAWHDGTAWHLETVDNAGGVGQYASLALDGSGNPHISYHDRIKYTLKYAYRDGTGWHIETVDSTGGRYTSLVLDDSSNPHISYQHGYYTEISINYAYRDWAGWHFQTVDGWGRYSSLALDSFGNPHLSYYDWLDDDLKYATWAGSEWVRQTVDRDGGGPSSLAVDGFGNPHISYYDHADTNLKYVHWTGSKWARQTVDSGGDVGEYTSLALDGSGNPHVSYYDWFNDDLKYATWTGSEWVSQTVDSAGAVGKYTSLAVDSSSTPHISYYSGIESGDLKYAIWTGSEWVSQTVDSGGAVGEYSSLAVDGFGNPHISYYDHADTNLKYATWTGREWVSQTVDSDGAVGQYTSLALDGSGNPHISYYDDFNTNLKYAYRDGTGWHIQTVDSGSYSSLALDGSGNPHISYSANGALKYAHWTGSEWVSQTVDSGSYSSLALDGSDNPHISYYDEANDALKYATWTGSEWVSQTVDSDEWWHYFCPSLALDDSSNPHISYIDGDDLKYAYRDESGWHIQTVGDVGDSGGGTSLALDTDGNPHISYYYGLFGKFGGYSDIMYTTWTGSEWVSQPVGSGGWWWYYCCPSLTLDPDDYPRISYYDCSNDDLKYAHLIPSLHLDKHASPSDGLRNNGILTYTLTLSSSGSTVQLWDSLPEALHYISGSITGTVTPMAVYSPAARTIVWEGILPAGTVHEVCFQVTPGITGTEALSLSLPIVNTAWVTSTYGEVGTSATVIVNAYRLYLPSIWKHQKLNDDCVGYLSHPRGLVEWVPFSVTTGFHLIIADPETNGRIIRP